MQQDNQQTYPYQSDEIDLKKLLSSLVARKYLIFGLTGFITLLAIITALNLTPTYKAISSFTSPSYSSIINLNKLQLTNETKESFFSNFLTEASSRELQTNVFLDGDYLTLFNPENNPINDVPSYISKTLESLKLSPPSVTAKDLDLGFLTELPYSISMEGSNAKVISKFLNDIVSSADKATVNKMMNVMKQKVTIRLKEILSERKLLLYETKQRRLNEIVVLTDAARLARSLGIIENNFKLIDDDQDNSTLTIAIGENKDLPQWYLYGETALLEKVDILNNRESDEPFISQLIALDSEKIQLDSTIIDSTGINSMQLSQAAIPTFPIRPNKMMIVLLAFIGGFIMSILLALIMNALKPDEERSS